MITSIIEAELKKENEIINNGSYEVKTPYYNMMLVGVPKADITILFPIEQITKRARPILKLPFRLGKLIYQTGEEVLG